MNKISKIENMNKISKIENLETRPSKEEAEEAVRTILSWIGENPNREGLLETPKRFIKAYGEFFKGYNENGEDVLSKTFSDVGGYDDIVLLKNISFNSFCEHHICPFVGKAHIAYLPSEKIVGISKLARLIDIYGHRLQTQETMTAQIANSMQKSLKPKGIAIVIDAEHTCMSLRGVKKEGVSTITTRFIGEFETNENLRDRFLRLIEKG